MTDKERLEEIKSRVWKDKGTYAMGDYSQREGYIYTLSDYDYEWLVKQAGRVEELEKVIGDLDENVAAFEILWLEEKRKNQRYKQALENIIISSIPLEIDDAVNIALQALEGEK